MIYESMRAVLIDMESSADLHEVIGSMIQWYARA